MKAQNIYLIPLNLQVFVYLLKGLLEQDGSESQEHLLLIATRWFSFEDQIPCCRPIKCFMCFKITNTIFQRYMKYLILDDDDEKFTFFCLCLVNLFVFETNIRSLEMGFMSRKYSPFCNKLNPLFYLWILERTIMANFVSAGRNNLQWPTSSWSGKGLRNFDTVGELLIFLVVKLAKILLKIVDTVGELLIFLFVKLASILMKIVDIVGES